jgi:hypothetical protein
MAKSAREVTCVGKAAGIGDLLQREVRGLKEDLGAINALCGKPAQRRNAR